MAERRWKIWVCAGCGRQVIETYEHTHNNCDGEEVQVEVVPADHPGLLSPGQAAEVARYLEGSGREEIQALWLHLSSYASEGEE